MIRYHLFIYLFKITCLRWTLHIEQHVVQETKNIDSLDIYTMYVYLYMAMQYKYCQASFDWSI